MPRPLGGFRNSAPLKLMAARYRLGCLSAMLSAPKPPIDKPAIARRPSVRHTLSVHSRRSGSTRLAKRCSTLPSGQSTQYPLPPSGITATSGSIRPAAMASSRIW